MNCDPSNGRAALSRYTSEARTLSHSVSSSLSSLDIAGHLGLGDYRCLILDLGMMTMFWVCLRHILLNFHQALPYLPLDVEFLNTLINSQPLFNVETFYTAARVNRTSRLENLLIIQPPRFVRKERVFYKMNT